MAQSRKQTIDLNSADEWALQQIEGIDIQRARIIIEYRENQGAIENWEQLEQVDGIGPKLIEKLKASARLGSGTGDGSSNGVSEASEEDAGSVLDDEELVEALASLAELDSEAAAAYEVASETLDDEDMSRKLLEFRDDHLRHVRDLNEVIENAGGSPLDEGRQPDQAFLGRLADTAAALGPKGLLVAMIANEMLTNGTYMSALELPCPGEVADLLQRNYADEQRHLRWLLEAREELGVDFPIETLTS
jgi:competence ComEA-like helix-hairpin-helix protein